MNRFLKNAALLLSANRYMLGRRLAAIRETNALTILNLHRVGEDDGNAYQPLSRDIFVSLLDFLQENFQLATFGDSAAKRASDKPKAILSFDDGYKDFIDVVVPILEKYRIVANQNIIPECVERQEPPLNVLAQDFIGKAPPSLREKLDVPGLKTSDMSKEPIRMGLRVSKFLKNKPMARQQELRSALLPQFQEWQEFRPTRMMSREEVRQLVGVHEIGAHSFSHASMEFESDEYFRRDLLNCREYFRDALQAQAKIYTFPNGSYRAGQVALARQGGYSTILLVGNTFSRAGADVHPRFGFHAFSEREAWFRAAGGFCDPSRTYS